ncbi:MAG TPA: hypothetical protein VNG13_13720 [Mycobacteriales bacterium]|nr:hypothetical protein [Mycobacteriales bacterium]
MSGETEVVPARRDQAVLYRAVKKVAGAAGRTRLDWTEIVRQGGAREAFSDGRGVDATRIEAAAKALMASGSVERRGPGVKYPIRAPAGANSGRPPVKRAGGAGSPGRGRAQGRTATSTRRGSAGTGVPVSQLVEGAGTASDSSATAPRGPLAAGLASLMGELDRELAAINDLSVVVDEHVGALNGLRADQQHRVGLLWELRATAGDGTLGAYIEERLVELRRPQTPEDDYPWPRA